jgi:hypothetical protein
MQRRLLKCDEPSPLCRRHAKTYLVGTPAGRKARPFDAS